MKAWLKTITALVAVGALAGAAFQPAVGADVPDFEHIVKQNRAAVVNVATKREVQASDAGIPEGMLDQLPPGHPLRRFFRRFGEGQGNGQKHEQSALGSGFIISEDGYILTNTHVIKDADEIVVKLADNRQLEAKVVGSDKPSDVALLKVDAHDLPTVEIGDSSDLQVGQWVLAIGSPFGLEHTATQGIVSALDRNLPNDTYTSFIQTDVAVNPGNSGVPLFDGDGDVIGINSQIYSRTGGYMGLSFAIPINTAMNVVDALKEHGAVKRGYLGVSIQGVDRGLAESFGLDKPVGALVSDIHPDTPAADSDLKVGDVILRFDGKKVTDAGDLPPLVGHTAPGTSVDMKVMRDGKMRDVEVEVGALSDYSDSGSSGSDDSAHKATLNIAVRPLTDSEQQKLGLDNGGLLVGKVGPGPMAKAGVKPGDILLKLDGKQLTSIEQLKQLVADLPRGKPVPLQIRRGDGRLFVSLTLPSE